MKKNHWPTLLSLTLLLVANLVGASEVAAQQREQKPDDTVAPKKNACSNTRRATFSVRCKDRYFLGETPTIEIATSNTKRSPQTFKEADNQKYSLELTGLFSNYSVQETKTHVWDGRWDLQQELTHSQPGIILWLSPLRRHPDYVTLAPGESTTLPMDLTRPFSSYFGVGPYRLIVKFERGQKVVKDFEVYFDHEKSVAVLAKMLANDNDHGQRNWAISNLAQFDRPKFIILLEELVKSGSEKQRDFASRMLAQTSAGWFDPLKLKIESKDRYQPGEDLIVAISIMNGSSTPQTVKYAHDQKFFLELSDVVATGSTPRTKTCVYTPSEAAQKPKLVTLGETDETTLSLNLAECLGARLGAGKYQLIVKPEYDERMRDQTAVRSFEVR